MRFYNVFKLFWFSGGMKLQKKKKLFKLNSVKKKMIAGFMLLTFLNVGVFIGFQTFSAYGRIEEGALDKSYAYAEHIEKIISPIGLKQPEKLESKIIDLQNSQYKMSGYIGVLDKNLKYIANTDKSEIGTEFITEETKKVIETNKSISFTVDNNGKKEYLTAVPLYNITMEGDIDSESGATAKIDVPGLVVVSIDPELMISRQRAELFKIIGMGFCLFAISIVIAVIISATITKPLQIIRAHLTRMADGDFTNTVSVKSKDELLDLAEDINKTNLVLMGMIGNVKTTAAVLNKYSKKLTQSSGSISGTSEEITQSMDEVAGRTALQSSSLCDTTQSVNVFSENLENINSSIKGIEESSIQIKEVADRGSDKIGELYSTMKEVQNSFKSIKDKIERLSGSVSQIHSITETINNVAKQTNLLSLNASIEAARAGEAGSGFVVVAMEVRKLADQTLQASQDISNLIAEISDSTSVVTNTTAEVVGRVNMQSDTISETISVFKNIVEQINGVIPNINEVAAALSSTMSTKDNILVNMESIASMSAEIAASAEEVSASVQEQSATILDLSSMSEQLDITSNDMIHDTDKFKIL
jgi:methyl-accepting chemotaxis protein